MKTIQAYQQVTQEPATLNDMLALLIRLVLAYGLYMPAIMK